MSTIDIAGSIQLILLHCILQVIIFDVIIVINVI